MEFKTIIIGFIIFLVIMWLYRYFFTDPTRTSLLTMGSAETSVIKNYTQLTGNAESSDFTYTTWIYVKDWNYKMGKEKIIIQRKNISDELFPKISLGSSSNDLIINMHVFSDEGSTTSQTESTTCTVKNIPLQKWTHITMTVNNRALDTYIDGKLVKTCILSGPPKIDGTANINICPPNIGGGEAGFKGNVAKVRYYSRSLNPREVYELYREGYSGSLLGNLFNKYKLRFSYIKDNEEVGSLEL
jgi:hypothetical protein